jgi:hypothetical protein
MAAPVTAFVELELRRIVTHSLSLGTVHLEQLAAVVRIGSVPLHPFPTYVREECYLDNGAYLSVFPQQVWTRFQTMIEWPTPHEEVLLPTWCKRFGGIAGGRHNYRLGRITVEFCDFRRPKNKIGPVDILALFALDNGQIRQPPLLGLSGGVFGGRRFLLAYDIGRAFLREMPP